MSPPSNAARVATIEYALENLVALGHSDEESAAVDLMTNFFHWADANDRDLGKIWQLAQMHYEHER